MTPSAIQTVLRSYIQERLDSLKQEHDGPDVILKHPNQTLALQSMQDLGALNALLYVYQGCFRDNAKLPVWSWLKKAPEKRPDSWTPAWSPNALIVCTLSIALFKLQDVKRADIDQAITAAWGSKQVADPTLVDVCLSWGKVIAMLEVAESLDIQLTTRLSNLADQWRQP